MSSTLSDVTNDWENRDSNAQEEKIFVAIRVRPLNDKELAKNDVSEWDCINSTTIIFKNSLQERSLLPAAYTFDRVFGCDVSTKQVYESAKRIALSALSGINSTIFAYGQTSSGKTYTMTGVTEYAVEDIFDYINRHTEREFVLKFSAIEIYNESVRDLLCSDGGNLRLLDDPERGTVIDKLTEVTLKGCSHLKELLSICEAQRQIGETNLNEVSSRSHQILRLTIESEARHYMGADNASSLTASVNFVDLAGSERASQTLSAGTRLKEGCHINRSLLTLGTVIRKLSKGRNGHIPYRDSKLTRILQNSLGGNARTAIICTLSPAHSHVEQSRNTLLFASCAKQVNTSAQVNVVMSEKALVKQLQKELARLENELRSLRSLSAVCASVSTLKEKELLIDKMDKEIKDLTLQRDLAQSRMQDMIRMGEGHYRSKSWIDFHNHDRGSWTDEYSPSEASDVFDPLRFDIASTVSSGTSHFSERYQSTLSSRIGEPFPESNEEQFLSDNTSPRLYIDKYFGPDPCKGWEKVTLETNNNVEDDRKELQCIEMTPNRRNNLPLLPSPESSAVSEQSPFALDDSRVSVERSKSCEAIFTTSIDQREVKSGELSVASNEPPPNEVSVFIRKSITEPDENLVDLMKESMEKLEEDRVKNLIYLFEPKPVKKLENSMTSSPNSKEASGKGINVMIEPEAVECVLVKETSEKEEASEEELTEVTEAKSVKELDEVIDPKPVELEELMPKVTEDETADKPEEKTNATNTQEAEKAANDWKTEFERQITDIIYLWDACHIPLIHRAYFFLIFRGDISDSVYLEVELRRLTFLKKAVHGVVKDDTLNSYLNHSTKALNREREMLSRKFQKKFTPEERENLFKQWGIDLKSKQRRLKLCRRLWSDPTNMEHINESANIVAKLVGFKGKGEAPKEMVGLSFSPRPHDKLKHFNWRHSLPSLM